MALAAVFGRCAWADNLCLRGPQQRALPHDALSVGDTIRLRAGGVDILTECDLAPPRTVRWSSSNEAVLRVTADGLVSAVSSGSAKITAHARLTSASHELTVKR